MPKVSVIIPVYGVEKYIERCADSLFQQTLNDIEYIFVDDCTPDRSIELLKRKIEEYRLRFAEENKVARIVRMLSNSGQAAVRKHGIQLATGEYIIHCDSDDWVDIHMYHLMYEKASNENADMVVCDYYSSDGKGNDILKKGCKNCTPPSFLSDIICQKISWAVWNKMVKRTIYNNSFIYPTAAMGEDMVICLQLLKNSNRLVYVDKPLYYYFNNATSITKCKSKEVVLKRFQQSIANASIIQHLFKEWSIYDKYKCEFESLLLNKKNLLRPLISERYYYKLWKDTFPEINYSILWNKKITLNKKIKHILTLLKLYKSEL